MRGLPPNLAHDDFQRHFSKQLTTTDAKLMPHRRIGYVGYKTPEDAAKAVKYYNKSFIHMSRIEVELARSVEEQSALRPSAHAALGIKRKHGTMNGTDFEENQLHVLAKKSNEAVQANEKHIKLQEFLSVMQPPAKSKVWEDQATLAAQTQIESVKVESKKATDAQTEEEYKLVPEKQRRGRESTQEIGQAHSAVEVDQVESNDTNTVLSSEEQSRPIAPEPKQVESDSDWLRSRTSRLLGLLDDDDASETVALQNDDQALKTTATEPPRESNNGDNSNEDVCERVNAQELGTIAAVTPLGDDQESLDSSGRLFIRNLAYSTTENDLQQLLQDGKYGAIEEVSHDSVSTSVCCF